MDYFDSGQYFGGGGTPYASTGDVSKNTFKTTFTWADTVWGTFIPITWGISRIKGECVWMRRPGNEPDDPTPTPDFPTNYWVASYTITQTEHTHGFAIGVQHWEWVGDPAKKTPIPVIDGIPGVDGGTCVSSQAFPGAPVFPTCTRIPPPIGAPGSDEARYARDMAFLIAHPNDFTDPQAFFDWNYSPAASQPSAPTPNFVSSCAYSFGYNGSPSRKRLLWRLLANGTEIYNKLTGYIDPGIDFVFHEGNLKDLPDSYYIQEKKRKAVPFRQQVYVAFHDFPVTRFGGKMPEIIAEFADEIIPGTAVIEPLIDTVSGGASLAPYSLYGGIAGVDWTADRYYHVAWINSGRTAFAVATYEISTRNLLEVHEIPEYNGNLVDPLQVAYSAYTDRLYFAIGGANSRPIGAVNPHTGAIEHVWGSSGADLGSTFSGSSPHIGASDDVVASKNYVMHHTQYGGTAGLLGHDGLMALFRYDAAGYTPIVLHDIVDWDAELMVGRYDRAGFYYADATHVGECSIADTVDDNGNVTGEVVSWNDNLFSVPLTGTYRIAEIFPYENDVIVTTEDTSAVGGNIYRIDPQGDIVWKAEGLSLNDLPVDTNMHRARRLSDLSGGTLLVRKQVGGGYYLLMLGDGSLRITSGDSTDVGVPIWDSVSFQGLVGGGQAYRVKLVPDAAQNNAMRLDQFIKELCVFGGYDIEDVICYGIDDIILGANITSPFRFGSLLNDICKVYRINRIESGKKLIFNRTLAQQGVVVIAETIDVSELAWLDASEDGRSAIKTTVARPQDVVGTVSLTFIDPAINYAANKYSYARPSLPPSNTVSEESFTLPIVMELATATELVHNILYEDATASTTYEFRLPPKYTYLEPGDIIVLTHKTFADTMQITEMTVNADRSASCLAKKVRSSSNVSIPVDPYIPTPPMFQGSKETDILIFDTPAAAKIDDVNGIVRRFAAAPHQWNDWSGGYVAVQRGNDASFYSIAINRNTDLICKIVQLPGEDPYASDNAHLKVEPQALANMGFQSFDPNLFYDDPDNNLAFIGNNERWEIIQFGSYGVDQDGIVTFEKVVRGRRGTVGLIGTQAVGDWFVPLIATSRDVAPLSLLGATEKLKGVGFNQPLSQPATIDNVIRAGNLMPWAPVVRPAVLESNDDITLAWLRRDRSGVSTLGSTRPPLALTDTPETYDLEIVKDGVVVRTVAGLTSPGYTYTAVDQATDGFVAPVTTLTVRVYQVSAVVGRGFQREATLNVA